MVEVTSILIKLCPLLGLDQFFFFYRAHDKNGVLKVLFCHAFITRFFLSFFLVFGHLLFLKSEAISLKYLPPFLKFMRSNIE